MKSFAKANWAEKPLPILSGIMKRPAARQQTQTIMMSVFCGFLTFSALPSGKEAHAAPPALQGSHQITRSDAGTAKKAFKAYHAKRWKKAARLAAPISNPDIRKLFHWLDLTRDGSKASFAELSAFITENPGWPSQRLIRKRAEEAMGEKMPAREVLDWFGVWEPVSSIGKVRLGEALMAIGKKEKARSTLRDAWINGNFIKHQEKRFYRRHKKLLTRDDHRARLDRLLWDGRYWPARRMLWRVNKDYRLLAIARMWLRQRRGNVDRAINDVPEKYKSNPGLVFERLRWRRRKGRDLSARELLADPQARLVRPKKWLYERVYLARRAVWRGHISEAYALASAHEVVDGPEFAEAEWLAGWIALRFLNEPKSALKHFMGLFDAVTYPVSRARAAYWAGRANETLGKKKQAAGWYKKAARYPTAFYGQLASLQVRPGQPIRLPAEPLVTPAMSKKLKDSELAFIVRFLYDAGEEKKIKPFILALMKRDQSPEWQRLIARLARRNGRPDLAIHVAKQSARDGWEFTESGYPALIPPPIRRINGASAVEIPFVLATIRQESAFYTSAKSGAGARGLMQLMPYTASRVARKIGLPYSRIRLTKDPDYNLTLGQSYLAELVDDFKGSYVLALSAYNAGPARAKQWIKRNGDPREKDVDAIDWIEKIPFNETRNYVQRVLENLQVYRHRLAETKVALTLEHDLAR